MCVKRTRDELMVGTTKTVGELMMRRRVRVTKYTSVIGGCRQSRVILKHVTRLYKCIPI